MINPKSVIDILELSPDKFEEHIKTEENKKNVRSVLKETISQIKYDISNLESTLDRFTQQETAALIVMGLLSVFGFSGGSPREFIFFALLFSFPFFILSIICFSIASKRIHINKIGFAAAPGGSDTELFLLRTEVIGLQDKATMIFKLYKKIDKWHRYQLISTEAFLTTFILYYYLSIFFILPDWKSGILFSTAILLFYYWLYIRKKRNWQKSYDFNTGAKKSNGELPL